MLDLKALQEEKITLHQQKDLGTILSLIAKDECVSKESSELLIKMMKMREFRQKLPNLIPAVTSYDAKATADLPDDGKVLVANKTGDLGKYNMM